jgi:hypothetical protein
MTTAATAGDRRPEPPRAAPDEVGCPSFMVVSRRWVPEINGRIVVSSTAASVSCDDLFVPQGTQ